MVPDGFHKTLQVRDATVMLGLLVVTQTFRFISLSSFFLLGVSVLQMFLALCNFAPSVVYMNPTTTAQATQE